MPLKAAALCRSWIGASTTPTRRSPTARPTSPSSSCSGLPSARSRPAVGNTSTRRSLSCTTSAPIRQSRSTSLGASPARVTTLKRVLDGMAGAGAGRLASTPLTSAARERLASLGYLSATAPRANPGNGGLAGPEADGLAVREAARRQPRSGRGARRTRRPPSPAMCSPGMVAMPSPDCCRAGRLSRPGATRKP